MDLNRDSELQAIFRSEIDERAAKLISGAEAVVDGALDADLLAGMARESHTIKGTARVMGYIAISDGALAMEKAWKGIERGELEPSAPLGEAMRQLARNMMTAVDAPPEDGTDELHEALTKVNSLLESEEIPATSSAPVVAPSGAGENEDGEETFSSELGGLLAFHDSWVREESTGVDTSKLYRLINRIAELRLDADALRETVAALRDAKADPTAVATLGARWDDAVDAVSGAVYEIQEQAMTLVATPLRRVTDTFPGLVRYLTKKTGKDVRLELVGDDIEIDRQVLDAIADSLRHLVVNAIEHGIELPAQRLAAGKSPTATLAIRAGVDEGKLSLTVHDDGGGVDWDAVKLSARACGLIQPAADPAADELHALLFEEGLTTSDPTNEFSGSGRGLSVVRTAVAELGGSMEFRTEAGKGTRVAVVVPTTRALSPTLIVRAGGQQWGIPEPTVVDRFAIVDAELDNRPDGAVVAWREGEIPLRSFGFSVGMPAPGAANDIVVVATDNGEVALTVEAMAGVREVAARSLGPLVAGTPHITGAAMLGGGDLALLVDTNELARRALEAPAAPERAPVVLVVDDSRGARQVVAATLAVGGFNTLVAEDADVAMDILGSGPVDALVVDYSMPGSDGVALAQHVRVSSDMPIVMVSGVAGEGDQSRALEAGVDVYFDKSDLRQGALVDTLNSLLNNRSTALKLEASQ